MSKPTPKPLHCHTCNATAGTRYYRWPTSTQTITPQGTEVLRDAGERAKWLPLGKPTALDEAGWCGECPGAALARRVA